MMKRLFAFPIALGMAASMLTSPAFALTNNKSCARVQQEYAQNGRVQTRSRSGKILPIYGGVPYADRKTLYCGPNQVPHTKYVITADKRRCPVAQRCV